MSIRDLIPTRFGKKEVPVRRVNDPIRSIFDDFDRMFDRFFSDFAVEPLSARTGFSPRIDFKEEEDRYSLIAELPGLDEKDVEVTLHDDLLTIRGEKREEKEDRSGSYYFAERRYGSFERTIPLPAEVDAEKVKAHFKNGLLTVELPKSEKVLKSSRKIKITSE
ncbi:MAG: Hsp20/alpha crystallin family protein [Nitrospirae bacterium]|nr:MAG: Hsp20/alpha crystallin family protein [Nitrospirota bacterium]